MVVTSQIDSQQQQQRQQQQEPNPFSNDLTNSLVGGRAAPTTSSAVTRQAADTGTTSRGHPTNSAGAQAAPSAPLSPRQHYQSQARKRPLTPFGDPTEALLDQVKKCRVSSTPGELRLRRDLLDCDLLRRRGVARFDKTAEKPLECHLTFLCPIGSVGAPALAQAGGAAAVGDAQYAGEGVTQVGRGLPTTFSIVVPKFYPHEPPLLYADRRFSRTCSFVREDGLLDLPFLSSGVWSSISTMAFVAEELLEGLRNYAAGEPQPWGAAKESRPDMPSLGKSIPSPTTFVACATADTDDERPQVAPHVANEWAEAWPVGGPARAGRGARQYGREGGSAVHCFGEALSERMPNEASRNSNGDINCFKAIRREQGSQCGSDTTQSMDVS